MKIKTVKMTLIAGIAGLIGISAAAGETINGAGASFPAPIYNKWTFAYNTATGNQVNYQSVGSGAGVSQLKNKTVDFGASDDPMTSESLSEAGWMQFPTVIGGVVPVVNIKGIESGKLKLSGDVLAKIYLGKIKTWNDPEIAKLNPGLELPKLPITPVRRADGSGTTWIFTNYLSKVSKEWSDGPGCGKDVKWPAGIAGKGNPGIANAVQKTIGAIGYVEYAYAVESKLTCASLQNQAGNFAAPGMESFEAAAKNADWANSKDFYMVLTNQTGEKTWPICGATYLLIYKDQKDASKAKEMLKFFTWCLDEGSKSAKQMHYISMPAEVVAMIKESFKKNITNNGNPIIE